MWGDKKPETPQPTTAKAPEPPAPVAKPASAKTEGIAMSTDAMRPLSSTPSGSTARLGASLHIKGEISGNEDLHIDGSVEGLVQVDDRRRCSARSRRLWQREGQFAGSGPHRNQEGWLGGRRFDHGAHHD